MCVEKDERVTDSRVKTAIQNVLGGGVLILAPTLALAVFNGWNTLSTAVNEQQHLVSTLVSIERRVASIEVWRIDTSNNRFRASDGEALRQIITGISKELHSLKVDVTAHNRQAEKYIEKIDRLEKSEHKHWSPKE